MSLLDPYWKLASDNAEERIAAAEQLLKGLQASNNDEDWNYALKRLIRGLSSSRGSARLGFSMALSEVLQLRASHITIDQYMKLCDQFFEVTSGVKGNEERGLLLGRLFALKILAKSSMWDAKDTNSDDLISFAKMLILLALKKAWLREPPFYTLCELVQRVAHMPKFHKGIKFVFEYLNEKGMSLTCEGVAIALAVEPKMRHMYNSGHGWATGDPLYEKDLPLLTRVLKDVTVSSGDVSDNKPYVHFVWGYILRAFVDANAENNDNAPPKKKLKGDKKATAVRELVDLGSFWNAAVDRDLFGPETSQERKMWGFEVFLLWSQEPNLKDISRLISPNFVKTLALQLSQKDRNLKKMAKKVASVITDTLTQTRPDEIVPIMSKFMMYSPNFDKISKTKLVHQLLTAVNDEANIAKLVKILLDTVKTSDLSDLAHKPWIFDNLVQLVRNIRARTASLEGTKGRNNGQQASLSWVKDIFEALIPLTYFVNTDSTKTANVSDEDREKVATMAQDRVMSILSLTLGNSAKTASSDPQSSWPYLVVQQVLNFAKEHPGYEPRVEFDDVTMKAKTKAEHILYKIHKKRNSSRHVDSPQLQAFELLFAMVLLQVYGSVPDSISMLNELQMCYQQINDKRRAYEDGEDSGSENEEDASAVLTEILISLLSQQSVVLRKLIEDVWRTFSDQFSEGSLSLLCEILLAQEGVEGQQSLFNIEQDSDAEDGDDEDEEDDVVDEEEMEAANDDDDNDINTKPSPDNESDISESNNSDAEEASDYELDEETKQKLAGALGVDPNVETNAKSDDTDSSEDDSMDDEQMSALDVHLSAIFRERRKQQTKAKEQRLENTRARKNVVLLKGRVLDLIDIYLAEQPEKLIGLVCVEPLLEFIKSTKEGRLAEKARELIKTRLCRKTNYQLQGEADIMRSLELLRKVHALAAVSKSKILSLACNQTSVFLSKLVLAYDKSLISAVMNIYSKSIQDWYLSPSNQSMCTLFIDFINFLDTRRKA